MVAFEAGLRNGIDDGSIRPDVAFHWVGVSEDHDLEDELNNVRDRVIRGYGRPPR